MQGIWDGIQRAASKCSISSAGSELQRDGGVLAADALKDKLKMDKLSPYGEVICL